MSIIDFLNDNTGAVTVLATIITALATVALAFLTARYVKLTSKLNKIHRPYIVVSLDYVSNVSQGTHSLSVKIKNIGGIVARNITIEDDPSPSPFTKALEPSDILTKGIDILPQGCGTSIQCGGKIDTNYIPDKPVTITIRYEDSNKYKYTDEHIFDFSRRIMPTL